MATEIRRTNHAIVVQEQTTGVTVPEPVNHAIEVETPGTQGPPGEDGDDADVTAVTAALNAHVADTANPHAVTKAQVGLGNVDNTSDANKPVSTAQAAAIAAVQADIDAHEAAPDPHSQYALSSSLGTLAGLNEITNSQVATGAAIALSKLASLTANRAVVTDGSGVLSPATTTAAQIGYLSDVTSSVQAQLDTKQALLNLALNQFFARASTGSAEAKTITDAALSFLTSASFAAMLTLIGGAKTIAVTDVTASGNWTKPSGYVYHHVIVISGGGAGGSGRKGAAGTVRCGGGGGAAGGRSEMLFMDSQLPDTVACTIGAGGTGGAARTTDDTNGANGTNGADSLFGRFLRARGGALGQGGTNAAGAGGGAITSLLSSGGSGGTASATGGGGPSSGGTSNYASTGGAAGAGITSGDVRGTGGQSRGGTGVIFSGLTDTDLPGATFVNADAGTAQAGFYDDGTLVGSGGAGSSSSLLTNCAPGGAGTKYGAGGGGGGASVNGANKNSGAGGDGAPGFIRTISFG